MTPGVTGCNGAWVAICLAATIAAGPCLVNAHEFWITVFPASVSPGETAPFVVGFGDQFPTPEPLPEAGEILIRVLGPSGGRLPLRSPTQNTPEGLLTGTFPGGPEEGLYIVDATLHAKARRFGADDFQAYLTRERLSSALSFRKALREEDRDAREVISMFAKCLVRVGQTAAPAAPPLGTRIELVPKGDPTSLRAGDTLHVRLFFNNGALSDAPVTAISAQGNLERLTIAGRTNADGEVDFVLARSGVWLIRAAQTLPRTAPRGSDTEWESYWASLAVVVAAK